MDQIITDTNQLPVMMTVEHVRRFMTVSRQKAYELANMAGFPAIRLGKVIRIPRDAFLRWLDAQTSNSPAA